MASIMIVEDDILVSMCIEDALIDAGHRVTSATNADRAVEMLTSDAVFDIVITDVNMPGSMDGLRLAAVIRERWPPIRLIIASGRHRPSAGEMPSNSIFLPKPFLPDQVVQAVGHAS